MKKKLLMGFFGLCLMLSVVAVKAETIDAENGSASADVTVWNVETPVYDVEISWNSLSYNWGYNEITQKYGWMSNNFCSTVPEDVKNNITESSFDDIYAFQLYNSRDCSRENSAYELGLSYEEVIANIGDYYYKPTLGGEVGIQITDNSEIVKVTPSIKWTSAEKYDWTVGSFYSHYTCDVVPERWFENVKERGELYTDSKCSVKLLDTTEATWEENKYYYADGMQQGQITENEIPDSFRVGNQYSIYLILQVDETKEFKTPEIGDTIGTVTISIK